MRCPRCKGPMVDLRGCAFDARAVEREGTCFAWGKNMFTCCQRKPLLGHLDQWEKKAVSK